MKLKPSKVGQFSSLAMLCVAVASCSTTKDEGDIPSEPNYSFEKSNETSRLERWKKIEEDRYKKFKRKMRRGNS